MSPPVSTERDRAAPPRRAPLVVRKRAERRAARKRIAARLVHPPSAEQRTFDPMGRGRLRAGVKAIIAGVAVVSSCLVHASVYGFGLWFGSGRDQGSKRDIVAIEVRERAEEPEKPPPPPPPPPEPERITRPTPPERKKAELPPPPEKQKPPDPGKPPPRVVGLSLESTGEGGSGPSFGVGNTRRGETEKRAVDPKTIDRKVVDPPPSTSPNLKASRIPTAGAKYVLPKRKKPIKPPYPKQLLTQGIEAAVTVMVSLDAAGKVTSVKIIKSSGFPEFDESARKTALAEEFEPASRDGNPIPYTLSYTYRFTIEIQ